MFALTTREESNVKRNKSSKQKSKEEVPFINLIVRKDKKSIRTVRVTERLS
jgi:hypothetical protein